MRCIRCGEEKSPDSFAWRDKKRGKRFAHCRACQAKYHRKHYELNRQRYIDKAARQTKKMVEERWDYLIEFLQSNPCVDCGESDVLVLEFDHVEGKDFGIAYGIRYRSWSALLAEIKKCEVVCGNCHRRRTARRGGHWRSDVGDPLA